MKNGVAALDLELRQIGVSTPVLGGGGMEPVALP